MGRKSGRRQQHQQIDRRRGRIIEQHNRYEETTYEYGDHVKPQRYPQDIRSSDQINIRMRLTPKNMSQEIYLDALRSSRVVIGNGSAGSGKTVLAVYVALEKLLNNEVKKIIITRPVVEAGEQLGFLPGTFEQKVLPYMTPMIDAFEQFIGVTATKKLLESERIVFRPLAYMRGITHSNCITGDSLVYLSDGTSIDIKSLTERWKAGETFDVLSYNHNTNEIESAPVTFAFQSDHEDDLVEIETEDGTKLQMTPDHKLFTVNRGYIQAKDLTILDELMQNTQSIKIAAIKRVPNKPTYDITVDGNHNFFTNGKILSHNCVVIGDELQNSTPKQMRLLLTRQGFKCYMFITGDPTQSDLREDRNFQGETGLEFASRKLRGRHRQIQVVDFSHSDVVRDPIMADVLTLLDAPDPINHETTSTNPVFTKQSPLDVTDHTAKKSVLLHG